MYRSRVKPILALALAWLFFQPPPPEHRGPGTFLVRYVPREQIPALCAGAVGVSSTDTLFACARGPVLIMPNPCEWPFRDAYAELTCHELGHGHGWKH